MKRSDLLTLEFYKYEPFSGSDSGIRYRVEKYQESEDSDKQLKVTIWPEPFSFENTPDDKKTSRLFDFSEDGLVNCAEWINEEVLAFSIRD